MMRKRLVLGGVILALVAAPPVSAHNAGHVILPDGTCLGVGSNREAPVVAAAAPGDLPTGQLDLIPGPGDQYGARFEAAMNRHDLGALVDCFGPDYRSEQPVHPRRGFGGRAQVEKNWSALFEGVPDFHAELLASAVDGDIRWDEWRWTGTRPNGYALDMRGVTIVVVRGGRIASARLYLEEVDAADADIDESIRGLVINPRNGA